MIFHQFRFESCRSYLVASKTERACVVVDPSHNLEEHLRFIHQHGLKLVYVIDTHTHADHISLAQDLANETTAKVVMHRAYMEQRVVCQNERVPGINRRILDHNCNFGVDIEVDEGDILQIGGIKISIVHTPGHTKDSICLKLADRILTGDTLMIGQCGRTDLPGGDPEQIYNSLHNKLKPLDDDFLIYPSHDYNGNINSSMGFEKINNIYIYPASLERFLELFPKQYTKMSERYTEPNDGQLVQAEGGIYPGRSDSIAGSKIKSTVCLALEKYFTHNLGKSDTITAPALKEMIDAAQKFLLVDVRRAEEYMEGHIKGAINVSSESLPEKITKLNQDMNMDIVVYSNSGYRSGLANIFFRSYGFHQVKSLELGMHAWKEHMFPEVK